jgi:hypothetical protein
VVALAAAHEGVELLLRAAAGACAACPFRLSMVRKLRSIRWIDGAVLTDVLPGSNEWVAKALGPDGKPGNTGPDSDATGLPECPVVGTADVQSERNRGPHE